MTRNLTEGQPLRLIAGFALPVFLSMLFQQFYNLVDTMIVGKTLGSDALAAVGATGSLNFMVIGFCSGMCAGFAIPMSQSFGAGDEDSLKRYIGNSLWLCLAFSATIAVITGLLCKPILRLMNTPASILDDSFFYIDIIFWGIPCTYLYNMLSSMIRAVGDSKTPVLFLGLASVLNIGLDLLFITRFHMGVAGAAVATVAAQGVSGLLCLPYIKKKFLILQPSGGQWRPDRRCMARLCGMGLPMGLQYSVTAIGSVILQACVNGLGTLYVAAVAAANKLSLFICTPFDALGSTIATYAGHNVGALKIDRVRRGVLACMCIGSVWALACFGIFWYFGAPLTTLFVDAADTALLDLSRTYLVLSSAFYIPLVGVNVYRFCIQGMGFGKTAMLAGVMELVGRAGMGVFLIPLLGYPAACLAPAAAWVLADAFLIPVYYHYLKKLQRRFSAPPSAAKI